MHEYSLTKTLLGQVAKLAAAHGAVRVTEVRVEVGPLAGVEPLLLASAFEQLAPDSAVAGARLVVDEVPLNAECNVCGATFDVIDFRFLCLRCGAGDVRITRGDALMLVDITIAEDTTGDRADADEDAIHTA